jgi:hypothetical protein
MIEGRRRFLECLAQLLMPLDHSIIKILAFKKRLPEGAGVVELDIPERLQAPVLPLREEQGKTFRHPSIDCRKSGGRPQGIVNSCLRGERRRI